MEGKENLENPSDEAAVSRAPIDFRENRRAKFQKLNPPEKTSGFRGLAFCLALLICNSAGSLASGLAGALALAAAALFSGSLQVRLVNCNNVLQKKHLFLARFVLLFLL